MSTQKFRNKYRVPSARAAWWNYGWNGAYFITICTKNRLHYFGAVENRKMNLANCGVLADVCWQEIPNHSKYVELGAFVVMPNHIHGILILDNPAVETLHATSLRPQSPSNPMADISPMAGTVSTIIRSYKSAVTRHAHRLGFAFDWQTRFHDHIIRNDAEFQRINDYIENNPYNWPGDKFFIR
ncbi:MAG: transposase [Bacteroidota bacterium]